MSREMWRQQLLGLTNLNTLLLLNDTPLTHTDGLHKNFGVMSLMLLIHLTAVFFVYRSCSAVYPNLVRHIVCLTETHILL